MSENSYENGQTPTEDTTDSKDHLQELGSETVLKIEKPQFAEDEDRGDFEKVSDKLFHTEQKPLAFQVKSEYNDITLENEELIIKSEDGYDEYIVENKPHYIMSFEEAITYMESPYISGIYQSETGGNRQIDASNVCGFQTECTDNFTDHLSEAAGFKCSQCSYIGKEKRYLQRHTLMHKDPRQLEMFKCNECSYQSKYKSNFRKHMLLHIDPSQLEMINCTKCSYQSKHKDYFRKHLLIHRDPSQVEVFKCKECSFQSRHRSNLRRHLLVHKDPTQMKLFKCTKCNYHSNKGGNFRRHLLKHKDEC